MRAPRENCAHAPCVVAAPEPHSSESLVPEAPLCDGRCVLWPAACCAWGERQPLLSAAGRVSYSALQNARECVHRRAGRPASLGWARGLWRAERFRGLLCDSPGRRPCLSAATPAARPARPESGLLPRTAGGSGAQVTVLVSRSSLNLGDCVDGRLPSPPRLCATCQAVTLTFSLCVSVR